ncbi:PREDICTED: uncharacterized protein LOC100633495 [Amphimedon queenslandica]|uniref:Uncharacterized protein n=1 Tax=Amphimedon queenslandica TaxID=400682 RepID=A0A1X7VTF4_AMPQE|nr:PREDICTED: uncharacterized protein LOC100633495 [Amphimedon queenslandica]|eukprot:XP_003382681.1 PREDICTED: uncharacterized protein LOC100633495 [Amphimedon queenslandica]
MMEEEVHYEPQSVDKSNKGLTPREKLCRVVTLIVCLILLSISIGGLVTLMIIPNANHQLQTATVQESVTTLLRTVDPYYYNVRVSTSDHTLVNVSIGTMACSSLVTYSTSHIETITGHHLNSHSTRHKLEPLEKYAYLVSGSNMLIEVNVTSFPPHHLPANDISLYVFTDWDSYNSFDQSQTTVTKYYKRIEVYSSTAITFIVRETGFYLYGLSIPVGTKYLYSYDITRFAYNSTKSTNCKLSSKSESCLIRFDNTMLNEKQCILSSCSGKNHSIYTINSELVRKPVTSGAAILISTVFVLLMILVALLFYDCYRYRLDSKLTTLDTCVFRRRKIVIKH